MYPVKPLELGHYRMAVDYERLTLFGLELNHKDLYRTFTEFNVGEKEVKRDENILEGIGLETEYEVYPEDTLVIKCKWYNTIQDDFTYGSTFALEKYENNIWVNVDFGEIGFTSEGYMLGPNEEPWQTFNMSWILDSLEQGKYRIKTDVLRDTLDGADFGPGNYPSYDIYSPFEIGDEKIKRNMTQLDDAYFYRNETYGFILKLDEDWKEPNIVELSNYSDLSTHDLYKALDPAYKILEIKHPSTNQSIKMIGFYRELWNKNARDATDGDLDLLPNILFSGPDMIFSTDKDLFDHSGDYIKSYNFIKTMKRY